MKNLRDWYAKPRPDSCVSLSKFLTEEEKKVLRKIKRQVRTFSLMNIEEYERLQNENAEYVFSLIEDYIREEDVEQVKEKVQEEISKYNIVDLTRMRLMSIALRILTEYLRVNENQDDERTHKLSKELSELQRETLMFIEYAKIRRVEEECTIRAKKNVFGGDRR